MVVASVNLPAHALPERSAYHHTTSPQPMPHMPGPRSQRTQRNERSGKDVIERKPTDCLHFPVIILGHPLLGNKMVTYLEEDKKKKTWDGRKRGKWRGREWSPCCPHKINRNIPSSCVLKELVQNWYYLFPKWLIEIISKASWTCSFLFG